MINTLATSHFQTASLYLPNGVYNYIFGLSLHLDVMSSPITAVPSGLHSTNGQVYNEGVEISQPISVSFATRISILSK
jgi:hypothetical protein